MAKMPSRASSYLTTKKPLNPFLPLMAALVGLAWITLWVWERSPYGRYLNHGELAALDLGVVNQVGLYVAGWMLMVAAMMLPTILPLVEMFRRLTQNRDDHRQLVALLIAGYVAVWFTFGLVAHIFDWGLHELVEATPILEANAWLFGAGALILAGAFQFSSLKYQCLEKCRAPLSFLSQYWRGSGQKSLAFALGVHHGLFCVGCCWALMLLMFAVGTGNVGWMLALGAVMAIEKNMPWGRRLSQPLGVALLAWGLLIAGQNLAAQELPGILAG